MIRKKPAGPAVVHVTITLCLSPTHLLLKSSPTPVSIPARQEFQEVFKMTIPDVSVAKAQSPESESVSSLFSLREDSPVIVLLQKAKYGSTSRFLKSGPDVNPV
jgi:hypothetical protein